MLFIWNNMDKQKILECMNHLNTEKRDLSSHEEAELTSVGGAKEAVNILQTV